MIVLLPENHQRNVAKRRHDHLEQHVAIILLATRIASKRRHSTIPIVI